MEIYGLQELSLLRIWLLRLARARSRFIVVLTTVANHGVVASKSAQVDRAATHRNQTAFHPHKLCPTYSYKLPSTACT